MVCPCKGCELRHVFTANGVTFRCHSNCVDYQTWRASIPKRDEALRYEMERAAMAKLRIYRRSRKDTRTFRRAAQ